MKAPVAVVFSSSKRAAGVSQSSCLEPGVPVGFCNKCTRCRAHCTASVGCWGCRVVDVSSLVLEPRKLPCSPTSHVASKFIFRLKSAPLCIWHWRRENCDFTAQFGDPNGPKSKSPDSERTKPRPMGTRKIQLKEVPCLCPVGFGWAVVGSCATWASRVGRERQRRLVGGAVGLLVGSELLLEL